MGWKFGIRNWRCMLGNAREDENCVTLDLAETSAPKPCGARSRQRELRAIGCCGGPSLPALGSGPAAVCFQKAPLIGQGPAARFAAAAGAISNCKSFAFALKANSL